MQAITTPMLPVTRRDCGSRSHSVRADCSSSCAWRCSRCAVSPTNSSAARVRRVLFTGNALHSDVDPSSPPSGYLGWYLTWLGQEHGFPVPEGGAGQLTAALVRRLHERGGEIRCSSPVTRVVISGRRGSRCSSPTATRSTRPVGCWPTSARPRCTASSWAKSTCPHGSCARPSTGSSGTTARSRSTGRSRGRSRGGPSRRPAPAPST